MQEIDRKNGKNTGKKYEQKNIIKKNKIENENRIKIEEI